MEEFEDFLLSDEDNGFDDEQDEVNIAPVLQAVASLGNARTRIYPRNPNIDRSTLKEFWTDGYATLDEERFKSRVRVTRETFDFILTEISPFIYKVPTNWIPNPIEPHRQLGLTLYRLARECDFQVIEDVLGVSRAIASETFSNVIHILVSELYDRFVVLLQIEEEWNWKQNRFWKIILSLV